MEGAIDDVVHILLLSDNPVKQNIFFRDFLFSIQERVVGANPIQHSLSSFDKALQIDAKHIAKFLRFLTLHHHPELELLLSDA